MNTREVSGPSFYCLEPTSIDSVKSCSAVYARKVYRIDPGDADSVHIVFIKDVADVVSYKELLNLYDLNDNAINFQLGISTYPNITDKERTVFSKKYVTGVRIYGWTSKKKFYLSVNIPQIIGAWPEYKNEDIMIPILRALNKEGFDKDRIKNSEE
ncbi:hypothetical protein [Pedobacter sp. UYP24]